MGGQFLDFMGDTAVMRGDIELMGGPPVLPLGKTLVYQGNLVWDINTEMEGKSSVRHCLKLIKLTL